MKGASSGVEKSGRGTRRALLVNFYAASSMARSGVADSLRLIGLRVPQPDQAVGCY
jgi:hypothetical protein